MYKGQKIICYADFETQQINNKTQVIEWVLLYSNAKGVLSTYSKTDKIAIINNKKYKFVAHVGIDIQDFIKTIEEFTREPLIYFNNFGGYDAHYLLKPLKHAGYIQALKEPKKEFIKEFTSEEFLILKERKARIKKHLNTLKVKPEKQKWKQLLGLTFPKEYFIFTMDYNIMKLVMGLKQQRQGTWKNRVAEFRDSMDIFPSSISKLGKMLFAIFKDPFYLKKEIEYEIPNFKGYNHINEFKARKKRFEYIVSDAFILFAAHKQFSKILPPSKWKLTIASTTYNNWQERLGMKIGRKLCNEGRATFYNFGTHQAPFYKFKFKKGKHSKKGWISPKSLQIICMQRVFPIKWLNDLTENKETLHEYLYNWFKGGIVRVNENYVGRIIKNMTKLDIKSSYPHKHTLNIMLPYGPPVFKPTKGYDFKFYTITILKRVINTHGLPWLPQPSLTGTSANYNKTLLPNEKYKLTDIDYKEFLKRYNVKKGDIHVRVDMYFQSIALKNYFGDYIKEWYRHKNAATKENNLPKKEVSKLMCNSLWGKLAQKIVHDTKIYLSKSETWTNRQEKVKAKFYLPFAICITSLGRMHLVKAIGNNYKNVVYCDTDSAFIRDYKPDDYPYIKTGSKLGDWTKEGDNLKVLVRRPKQYIIQHENGHYDPVVAGINFDRDLTIFNFNDFIEGTMVKNQLEPTRTPEGVILKEISKEIKPIWDFKKRPEQIYHKKEHFLNVIMDILW